MKSVLDPNSCFSAGCNDVPPGCCESFKIGFLDLPVVDLGLDVNAQADTGRTATHGAAHKGRADVIQILFDHGAKLDVRDYGNTDNRGGKLAVHTWQPVDYADGLVRVGVQSAIGHPETGALLRKLMTQAGFEAPPMGRTLESICITEACDTGQ